MPWQMEDMMATCNHLGIAGGLDWQIILSPLLTLVTSC